METLHEVMNRNAKESLAVMQAQETLGNIENILRSFGIITDEADGCYLHVDIGRELTLVMDYAYTSLLVREGFLDVEQCNPDDECIEDVLSAEEIESVYGSLVEAYADQIEEMKLTEGVDPVTGEKVRRVFLIPRAFTTGTAKELTADICVNIIRDTKERDDENGLFAAAFLLEEFEDFFNDAEGMSFDDYYIKIF